MYVAASTGAPAAEPAPEMIPKVDERALRTRRLDIEAPRS
jgi:hypothetical protein